MFFETLEFEDPLLQHQFSCDAIPLSASDPSWNSCDSIIDPASPSCNIAIVDSNVAAPNCSPVIPLENLIQDHTVKVQRLSRKAQLARENRKRKNSQLHELENECQELREEVKRLRERERSASLESHNLALSHDQRESAHETLLRQRLRAIAADPNADTANENAFRQAFSTMADYIDMRGRQSLLKLQSLLIDILRQPNKGPERFLFWILSRQDKLSFKEPSGIWRSLFGEYLQLNDDKLGMLEKLQPLVLDFMHGSNQLFELVRTLSQTYESCITTSRAVIDKFMETLTYEQTKRLIQWFDDNQICVNELVR